MATFKRSTIWVDAAGMTQQGILTAIPQTLIITDGTASIEAAIAAISNAGRLDAWSATPLGPSGAAVAAVYESVGDYALLSWRCVDGTITTVKVFAPKTAIFLADGMTVDITNAGVAALSFQVIGSELSASGSPAATFLGGIRRRYTRDYP